MSRSGSDRESVASVTIRLGGPALVRGAKSEEPIGPVLLSSSSALKISARVFISVAGQRRQAETQLNRAGLCSLDNKLTVAGASVYLPDCEH
jgi:hypothetical protein